MACNTNWLKLMTHFVFFGNSKNHIKNQTPARCQISPTFISYCLFIQKHFGTFLFQKERLMFLLPLQNVVITWHLLYSKVKKIRSTIDVKKNHFFFHKSLDYILCDKDKIHHWSQNLGILLVKINCDKILVKLKT